MSPKFDNPPVVERVIGIQFEELPFYTNSHAGWFWKGGYLEADWDKITTAPAIEDRMEIFDEKQSRIAPSNFRVFNRPPPERSQIVRASDGRMIQIQNTRFLLNWNKHETSEYLDFPEMLSEFNDLLAKFREFVRSAGNIELKINQWEITYFNNIPRGELWATVSDWQKLFPGLFFPIGKHQESQLNSISAKWSVNLPSNAGRLHLDLQRATNVRTNQDLIRLELTARGPAKDQSSYEAGINIGHKAIVETFKDMTSETAHKIWGLQ